MSKILIVDDDPEIQKLLRFKLIQEGYGVITTLDAYGAIQNARREKPDLIILDIMLPAGGGLHVLKSIRSIPEIATIPVLVLTAMTDEETRQKITQEGVQAYLQKPHDYDVLIETIKKLLKGEPDTGRAVTADDDHKSMGKILVVDDDPDITRHLGAKFGKEGYEVIIAVDAYNALQSIHRGKPDLIILDIMLPGGGGLHVLKKIRLVPGISMTPVVILTGNTDEKIKKDIETEGVDAYIQKPYDYDVLSVTVKKLLTK